MEGYGQGDKNKFYLEERRNYRISAHFWALRNCTFPAGIITSLEAQIEGNESFECEDSSMHGHVFLAQK